MGDRDDGVRENDPLPVRAGVGIFFLALVLRLLALAELSGSPWNDVLLGDARHFDAWGATTVTAGLVLFVFALTRAPTASPRAIRSRARRERPSCRGDKQNRRSEVYFRGRFLATNAPVGHRAQSKILYVFLYSGRATGQSRAHEGRNG
jgi:hypothetical protein